MKARFGKFWLDWVGAGLIVFAVLFCYGPSVAHANTVTSITWQQIQYSSQWQLHIVWDDGSTEDYYWSGGNGYQNWSWAAYSPQSGWVYGYGAPALTVVCNWTCTQNSCATASSLYNAIANGGQQQGLSVQTYQTLCGAPSCTGGATWTASTNGQGALAWSVASNTCSSGCNPVCPGSPPSSGGQTVGTGCSSSATGTCPTGCSGNAQWTSAENGSGLYWSAQSNTCSSGCYPVCPASAPSASGLNTQTACTTASTGNCPTGCGSGTCTYTGAAIDANDVTKGYKWVLSTTTCPSASQCACPTYPTAACPKSSGDTTTMSCGATGGTVCAASGSKGNTNAGSCQNSCVFTWTQSQQNNCSSSTTCGWVVEVQRVPVAGGGSNAKWSFVGVQGPACSTCGCATPPSQSAQEALASGNDYQMVPCTGSLSVDGSGSWAKTSGDCGTTCNCVPPTGNGSTNGETQTVACTAQAGCPCGFSWDSVKSSFTTLLNQKLGAVTVAAGDRSDEPPCWTFDITLFGTTTHFQFCTAYTNPTLWWHSVWETARGFIRSVCKLVLWWTFTTWLFDTLVQGW